MNPSTAHSWDTVVSWLERNEHAGTFPGHIQQHVDAVERYHKAEGKLQQDFFGFDYSDAEHVRELLSEELSERASRRAAEHHLADYIEDVSLIANRDDLGRLVPRLRECRMSGSVGLLPDGNHVVYWDSKCGLSRLCPDESREETQRLTDFYLPEIMDFLKKSPTHRVFYAVLTEHNYRPGDLARGKQYQFNKIKRLLGGHEFCQVMFVDGPACGLKPISQGKEKLFPNIQGALTVQEDPLSASMDWNVHTNMFFLVRGAFNYQEVRQAWGANIHIQKLEGDESAIRKSLLEAIKYSARIVPEKSHDKAEAYNTGRHGRGFSDSDSSIATADCHDWRSLQPGQVDSDTDGPWSDRAGNSDNGEECDSLESAPAMTEWPAERFCEWWDANQKFRRTRAYGLLYAAHGKRWDREVSTWRQQVCYDAGLEDDLTFRLVRSTWKEAGQHLDKKEREKLKVKLRHAMVYGEKVDYSGVKWIGNVNFSSGGSYSVDLIPGYNFSGSTRRDNNFFETGPPG